MNKTQNWDHKIDIKKISGLTTGFTGADIKNMVNIAGFNSVNSKRDLIIQEDLELAFDRIQMGLTKKTIMVEYEEKLKTAYHEIGHCLAALLSKGTFKIHKVTILPRGDSLG